MQLFGGLSTAKRFILVGVALLVAALALALAAMYSEPFSLQVEARYSVNGSGVVVQVFRAIPGSVLDDVYSVTAVFSNKGSRAVNVTVLDAGSRAGSALVEPGRNTVFRGLTPLATVLLRPGEPGAGGCCVEAVYTLQGRRYPYQLLGLPSFALMLAGTASLGLGAVLRLAGLEEG